MIADPLQDGSAPTTNPPAAPAPAPDPALEAMRAFQLELLGATLQRFIEDVEGAIPSEQDLDVQSMHCCFSSTPLTRFRKGAYEFTNYFVWRGVHALAHGFLVPKNPTGLVVCRLTRDQWPPALSAYVSQHYGAT